MEKRFKIELSSFALHIIAMALMLCDHIWGALITDGHQWLTAVGRLAFPIFAFLIVEGYFRTRSVKKYAKRLLIFALVSEIPFNLMMGGALFNITHQNVLFTLLLGLLLIHLNEKEKEKKLWVRILVGATTVLLGFAVGYVLMLDYYGVGVVTVLVFYFLRKRAWWSYILQLAVLWFLNTEILGGLGTNVMIFGREFFFAYQELSILALVPIWLYRGKKGCSSQAFKYFCYAFYPAHMLVLWLINLLIYII